jgi:hypothetical protein
MKVLFITTGADSKTKSGWEDLVCDRYEVTDAGVVKLFTGGNLTIAYKLAEGEALVYSYEDLGA